MVKTLTTLKEFLSVRELEQSLIGFVPTMGNLHDGHLSLLEKALQEYDTVYFSIFVNPKQFGPQEDFAKYPRTLDQDLEKITSVAKNYPSKNIIVFAPHQPSEVFSQAQDLSLKVEGLSDVLEGSLRPGHFEGVATVVYRLFELVKPTRAYFGLKDYQQFLVISQMVKDLKLPVEVIGMPIIREDSGLALSSRNQYLTPQEKQEALILRKALLGLESLLAKSVQNIPKVQKKINEVLQDKNWNYLEMRNAETLSPDLLNVKKIVILGVYQLRQTRLLDNLEVNLE